MHRHIDRLSILDTDAHTYTHSEGWLLEACLFSNTQTHTSNVNHTYTDPSSDIFLTDTCARTHTHTHTETHRHSVQISENKMLAMTNSVQGKTEDEREREKDRERDRVRERDRERKTEG